jgi:hypothetical protein
MCDECTQLRQVNVGSLESHHQAERGDVLSYTFSVLGVFCKLTRLALGLGRNTIPPVAPIDESRVNSEFQNSIAHFRSYNPGDL